MIRRSTGFGAILALAVSALVVSAAPQALAASLCPSPGKGKAVKNLSFTLSGASGTRTVSQLMGNVRLGDHITATFDIPAHCPDEVLSIASYEAPGPPPYTLDEALQQTLFDSDTGDFTPGTYSLNVDIPPDVAPSAITDPIDGTTIDWTGKGNGTLLCQGGGHWVLAPAQGITAATLTVNGVTYAMTQNGAGSFAADSAGPLGLDTTASATYQGSNSHASVQLSHCSHFQVDFGQYPVQNPPQYRLTGGGISHDSA